MAMTHEVTVTTGWVVLGADDRVVVILLGQDAADAAEDWASQGHRVVPVTL